MAPVVVMIVVRVVVVLVVIVVMVMAVIDEDNLALIVTRSGSEAGSQYRRGRREDERRSYLCYAHGRFICKSRAVTERVGPPKFMEGRSADIAVRDSYQNVVGNGRANVRAMCAF